MKTKRNPVHCVCPIAVVLTLLGIMAGCDESGRVIAFCTDGDTTCNNDDNNIGQVTTYTSGMPATTSRGTLPCNSDSTGCASSSSGTCTDGVTTCTNDNNNIGQVTTCTNGSAATTSCGTLPCNSDFTACASSSFSCEELFSAAKSGDTVIFGHYQQQIDNTDKQPIEWIVLDKDHANGPLLLSKFVLEQKHYNQTFVTMTWEKSTLRSWLNGFGKNINTYGIDYSGADSFLNIAFTAEEQSCIATVTNKNPGYVNGTSIVDGGADTQDKVFLLTRCDVGGSYAEDCDTSKSYFATSAMRIAYGTPYLFTTSVHHATSDCYEHNCTNNQYASSWLLRSPGYEAEFVTLVGVDGSVGYNYVSTGIGVRPALHLKK